MNKPAYLAWGQCDGCGFQGTLGFEHMESESYDDPDAGFYLLRSKCPACEQEDNVLVTVDEYQVDIALALAGNRTS